MTENADATEGSGQPLPVVLTWTLLSWLLVAITQFFRGWLITKLWLLALPVLALAFIAALWLSGMVAVRLARRRGALTGTCIGLVSAGLAVSVIVVDWTSVFAVVWFNLNRADFIVAEQLVRSGALGAPETWAYYGADLPFPLSLLSVSGKIATIGVAGGEPALFIPAYMGIPDDAYGFVHLRGPVEGSGMGGLDGFGAPLRSTIDLGDGWYWADLNGRGRGSS
jgi:hypothetical protein